MIEVKLDFTNLKIYIDGLLHLMLRRDSILCIHSYKNGSNYFVIEYQLEATIVKTEYKDIEIWKTILQELDKLQILIDEPK